MIFQIKMIFPIIFTFFCLITASADGDGDARTFCPAPGTTASIQTEAARINHADLKKVATTCLDESGKSTQLLEESEAIDILVNEYLNDPRNKNLTKYLIDHAKAEAGGKCFKYVKDGLVKAKLTNGRPIGVNALSAVDELKCHGFINLLDYESQKIKYTASEDNNGLLKGEYDASKGFRGAVYVYESGIPCLKKEDVKKVKQLKKAPEILNCGHIEVQYELNGKVGYVSDFKAKNGLPITHSTNTQKEAPNRLSEIIDKLNSFPHVQDKLNAQIGRYKLAGIMIPESNTDPRFKANKDNCRK